jgi:hypothetical protein
MGEIYRSAKEVIVGLQDERVFGSPHYGTLSLASRILDLLASGTHLRDLSKYFEPRSDFESGCKGLDYQLQSEYFTRRWTVQELRLARKKTVLFPWGTRSWEHLVAALETWNRDRLHCFESGGVLAEMSSTSYAVFCHTRSLQRTEHTLQHQHIWNLLMRYPDMLASDPRDSIFAFRALHTAPSALPSPDYDEDKATVFTKWTLWFIADRASLHPLAIEHIDRDPDLPSWVIDFAAKPLLENNYFRLRSKFSNVYNVARGLPMDAPCATSGRLRVNGIKVRCTTVENNYPRPSALDFQPDSTPP